LNLELGLVLGIFPKGETPSYDTHNNYGSRRSESCLSSPQAMSCDFGYKAAWNNLHENETITLAYSLYTFLTCRIITYLKTN